MNAYYELLKDITIPKFYKIHQIMNDSHVENIQTAVHDALNRKGTLDAIKPKDSVCIAVGSREISNISTIVRCVGEAVKSVGGQPFIIPSMGSHGGADAAEQKKILAGYGITDKTMGIPIISSMETEVIGETGSGIKVRIDKLANHADFIIPVGRIKPHTDFYGDIQSGLCKMAVIGMGNQYGAYICHAKGFKNMSSTITSIADVIFRTKSNMFGLGIIENAYHKTHKIVAVPAENILNEEPGLLILAKENTAKIPFKEADMLVVNEIGKNISGAGMDSKVTGRSSISGISAPFFKSIAVLNLTEKSKGNFTGLGNADVTTTKVFQKLDFEATYTNAITSLASGAVRIPVVMPNDRLAIKFALLMASDGDGFDNRVVWINDTLSLNDMYISESLIDDAKAIASIKIGEEAPLNILFDRDDHALGFEQI